MSHGSSPQTPITRFLEMAATTPILSGAFFLGVGMWRQAPGSPSDHLFFKPDESGLHQSRPLTYVLFQILNSSMQGRLIGMGEGILGARKVLNSFELLRSLSFANTAPALDCFSQETTRTSIFRVPNLTVRSYGSDSLVKYGHTVNACTQNSTSCSPHRCILLYIMDATSTHRCVLLQPFLTFLSCAYVLAMYSS